MYIHEDLIQRIKERVNIVELISEYVSLKRTGENFKGLCPFHSEKTPSFVVSPKKEIFHCFGCGVGGNVFSFIMKIRGLSFPEAVEYLAERANIDIRAYKKSSKSGDITRYILQINEIALEAFKNKIFSQEGKKALNYLIGRKIDIENIKKFNLGFAPKSWDFIFKKLTSYGFKPQIIERTGLVIKRKNSSGYYDRFRNRIIFPIMDSIGRCIGFGGRIFEDTDEDQPKYVNTSENEVFKKGKNLYGFNIAEEEIRNIGMAIIVEGYLDVIRLHKEGIKNVVAPLGTALTQEQFSFLKKFTEKIYLCFDSDEAGKKATLRSISLAHKEGIDPYIIELPGEIDPDNFFNTYKAIDFMYLLENATEGLEFLKKYYINEKKLYTANEKIVILNKLFDHVNNMKSDILINDFIVKISKALDLKEYIVRKELLTKSSSKSGFALSQGKSERALKVKSLNNSESRANREIILEVKFMVLLLAHPELINIVLPRITDDFFTGRYTKILWKEILRASTHKEWNAGMVLSYLENQKFVDYLSKMLISEPTDINPKEQIMDLFASLKESKIRRKLKDLNKKIEIAELENDEKSLTNFIIEKQSLRNELEKVRLLRNSKKII